jgi:hypothetical protein
MSTTTPTTEQTTEQAWPDLTGKSFTDKIPVLFPYVENACGMEMYYELLQNQMKAGLDAVRTAQSKVDGYSEGWMKRPLYTCQDPLKEAIRQVTKLQHELFDQRFARAEEKYNAARDAALAAGESND